MTNSRFRNNGQPINIAVAIRRAGKHENDVDAVMAEQGGPPTPPCVHWRARDNRSKWETEVEGGEERRGCHKDIDRVSFVANIYAISYPYTSPVRCRFVPPEFSSGRETGGCYLNFPFRSCNSSPIPLPIPTNLIATERRFLVATGIFLPSPPLSLAPSFKSPAFFHSIGRLAARAGYKFAKRCEPRAVINDSIR